jgi:hypothetical protein
MERYFGISYPTVKGRLDKLAKQLKMVEFDTPAPQDVHGDVLDSLEKGEINVEEALRRLEK